MSSTISTMPDSPLKTQEKDRRAIESKLRQLFSVDLDQLKHDSNLLKSHGLEVKNHFKTYHKSISSLIFSHAKDRSIAIIQNLKDERNMMREEVREHIIVVNILFDDNDKIEELTSMMASSIAPNTAIKQTENSLERRVELRSKDSRVHPSSSSLCRGVPGSKKVGGIT